MSSLEKSKKLEELFAIAESRRTAKLENFEKLKEVKAVLESAKSRGFSYVEISKVLKEGGLEVPLHQVKAFFHEELKVPLKRRNRKKKSPTLQSNPATQQKSKATENLTAPEKVAQATAPTQAKKGFRVAGDDL